MMPEAEIFRQAIRAICREAAFEIHGKIVARTPIDTGRAKASWNLNPDSADPGVAPVLADKVNLSTGAIIEKAAPGASPLSKEQAEIAASAQRQKIGPGVEVIVISNNLDYIEKLENGSSQQAPAGMFTVSLHPDAVQNAFDAATSKIAANV